ncbi:unnamed protein product [Amoebophrya sp. A25]|nr:unnamed protein product [Amoebophrya sp. A25]|eukprot:GSA25T00009430001.1
MMTSPKTPDFAGSTAADTDNIFNLKQEPQNVWFFGHIYQGVKRANALEKELEKAALLGSEEKKDEELARIQKEALKTSWPIAEYNKATFSYENVYRQRYPETISHADYVALQDCKKELTQKEEDKSLKAKLASIRKRYSVGRRLWSIWGFGWCVAGLGYFIKAASDFTAPIFIKLLIESVSTLDMVKFTWTMIALFVVRMLGAMGLQYGVHFTMRQGLQMRGVCGLAVLEKSLETEPATREFGTLTNLQSVDAQALLDTVPFVHWLFIQPIALLFGAAYIIYVVGISGIIGLASGLIVMPFAQRRQKAMGVYEKKRMAVK